MKRFRKMLVLVVAMVMALGLSTVAHAATVEIIDSDNYVADRTFNAYKVFDGDWEEGKLTNLKAGNGIDWDKVKWGAVKALGGDFATVASPEDLIKALDGKTTEDGEKIAKILKDAVIKDNAISVTNDGTLEDGYYIIIDETTLGNNDVANAALLQVAGDKVTINVKTDKPHVEKKIDGEADADTATAGLVDTNNGQVNDLVPYVITATVPDTTHYDKYYMEFNDTVSDGLDISAAAGEDAFSNYTVQVGTKADDGTVTYTNMEASKYRLVVDPVAKTIHVQFIDVKGMDGQILKLSYKAKINEDAVVGVEGNPNTVTLTYTNSPDHSGDGEYDNDDYTSETPEDVVITYLTGIKIIKIDGKTKEALEGAEFQITGTRSVDSKVSGIRFVEATDGEYYKLANGTYTKTAPTTDTTARYDQDSINKKFKKESFIEVQTETKDVKVTAISDENGYITFSELGAGTYTLKEVTAPAGYNLLADPITVVINYTAPTGEPATGKEQCTWATTSDGVTFEPTEGLFKITIENNQGSELPSTGGMGTTLLYTIGGVLVAVSAVGLIARRKMSAEQ